MLVFLITVTMGSVALVICSAQPVVNGMESEEPKVNTDQSQSGVESEDNSLSVNEQDYFKPPDYNPVGAILAVLFVLALFVVVIYISKKLLPKITNLSGKEIRIVETIHLGPRKAVHLLEVENRRFLIGSTNENITKLADLSGNIMDLSSNETNYN